MTILIIPAPLHYKQQNLTQLWVAESLVFLSRQNLAVLLISFLSGPEIGVLDFAEKPKTNLNFEQIFSIYNSVHLRKNNKSKIGPAVPEIYIPRKLEIFCEHDRREGLLRFEKFRGM